MHILKNMCALAVPNVLAIIVVLLAEPSETWRSLCRVPIFGAAGVHSVWRTIRGGELLH